MCCRLLVTIPFLLFRPVGRYLVSSVLVPFRYLVTQCLISEEVALSVREEDRRFRCSLQSVFMSRADSSLITLDCLLGSYTVLATSCSLWKLQARSLRCKS